MDETSENRLRRAVELSQALMCRASLEGAIMEVNSAWSRLLGWSETELIGKDFLELVHPDDLDKTREQLELGKAGTTPRDFENRYRHKDGSYRSVAWTAVTDASHLYANGCDITAQKDAIEALRRTQETLRHLQNAYAIGQLSGEIAHGFNNSLQNIVASLELVRALIGGGRSGETERFITTAVGAARDAAALNQKVQGLSRRQPQALRLLSINELITGMEDLLRHALPRSIKLDLKLPAGVWPTLCDGNEAESALLNLILNARDALPVDGTITIETSNVDWERIGTSRPGDMAPGQYACIAVTDSGTGMGREVVAHAFDAFFTTKAPGLGLGLGLTMVDEFSRQNGGGVTIQSEIGRGTSVKLYLPRHKNGPSS